jgi:hypothetical protein
VPVRCCTTVHVYDAVVIGAGQAGLSASYHLRLISGSTTCPRRGADGRSRLSPSPSQRRPAAASSEAGAAGWEACHREDLAASPVRRHPKWLSPAFGDEVGGRSVRVTCSDEPNKASVSS